MDANAPKENPPADFNKLDLNQLQGSASARNGRKKKRPPLTVANAIRALTARVVKTVVMGPVVERP